MSFYAHAPVTLSFMILNGLFRVLFSEQSVAFSIHRIINNYEFYRLLTGSLVFHTPPVFLTGMIAIHVFRDIERQLGAFKFASFMTLAMVFTTAAQMALSVAVPVLSGNSLRYLPVSGAYFYILACLPLYFRYIPALYQIPVQLFKSVRFSEKSFLYFLVFQAVASMTDSLQSTGAGTASVAVQTPWLASFVSVILNAAPALTVGLIYVTNLGRLHSYRLPGFVRNAAAAVSDRWNQLWSASGTPSGSMPSRGNASAAGSGVGGVGTGGNPYRTLLGGGDSTNDFQTYQQQQTGLGMGGQQLPYEQSADAALQAALRASMGHSGPGAGVADSNQYSDGIGGGDIPVTEENIDALVALGLADITREQARAVLARSYNDMDRAANALLSGEY